MHKFLFPHTYYKDIFCNGKTINKIEIFGQILISGSCLLPLQQDRGSIPRVGLMCILKSLEHQSEIRT
jgi:hypothetical protein